MFIGRTDAEAETPILWPLDVKRWLTGKDPDAGRDWGQEEKGTAEDEMARWHHQLWWTWVWVNSGSWWWTGRPGVLWFMGLQRVGHDWATELNWTESSNNSLKFFNSFKFFEYILSPRQLHLCWSLLLECPFPVSAWLISSHFWNLFQI